MHYMLHFLNVHIGDLDLFSVLDVSTCFFLDNTFYKNLNFYLMNYFLV